MPITHRIQAAAKGDFEKKILEFLENNFEAMADSTGKRGFGKYNKRTQLDYLMSYVQNDREYWKEFSDEDPEFDAKLTKWLKLAPHAQLEQLLPFFNKLDYD
jgi:hypothetical protein